MTIMMAFITFHHVCLRGFDAVPCVLCACGVRACEVWAKVAVVVVVAMAAVVVVIFRATAAMEAVWRGPRRWCAFGRGNRSHHSADLRCRVCVVLAQYPASTTAEAPNDGLTVLPD